KTTTLALCDLARSMKSRIFRQLPEMSPTVGLIWAKAIFMTGFYGTGQARARRGSLLLLQWLDVQSGWRLGGEDAGIFCLQRNWFDVADLAALDFPLGNVPLEGPGKIGMVVAIHAAQNPAEHVQQIHPDGDHGHAEADVGRSDRR